MKPIPLPGSYTLGRCAFRGVACVLVCAGVAGCFEGNAGGPGLEPPELGGMGSSAGANGAVDVGGAGKGPATGGMDPLSPPPEPNTATCSELEASFATELASVQSCTANDTCVAGFHGSGCSDGLFPLCSVVYRSDADVEGVVAIDQEYRDRQCATGTSIACASCALPGAVECVNGECMISFGP